MGVTPALINILYRNHLESSGVVDPIAEQVAQYVNDVFGYSANEYKIFEYKEPSSPDENSKALLSAIAEGNEFLTCVSSNEYELVGRFLSAVFLIEYKFENLLKKFCPKVSRKTFGQKIIVYEDFLSVYEPADDEEIEFFKSILKPLKELNSIRNKIAHDIKKFT